MGAIPRFVQLKLGPARDNFFTEINEGLKNSFQR